MNNKLLTQTKINLFLLLLENIDFLTVEEGEIFKLLSMDPEVMNIVDYQRKYIFLIIPSSGFLDENGK